MEKTAKIKFITPANSGKWASVDVEMENGDKGNYLLGEVTAPRPFPHAVGDTITYTLEESPYGAKLKIPKPKPNFGGGGGKASDNGLGMAVGAAINCTIDLIVGGKVEMKDIKATAQRIIDISVELKNANREKFM